MTHGVGGEGADLPIVLVLGAGRSGTNLLADVLDAEPAFHNTVENRYIWNYKQKTFAYDQRSASDATDSVVAFIRDHFCTLARRYGAVPLDKTPSNVFRIPFVAAVFPRLRIIHIIRDGRDNLFSRQREMVGGNAVVASQDETGEVMVLDDFRLAFIKRRLERVKDMLRSDSLPARRIPAFLADNGGTFARQFLLRRPARYGERFPGMEAQLAAHSLLEVAAIQWREGVMSAVTNGRRLGPAHYCEIRYEDLLDAPDDTWRQIAAFLAIQPDGAGRDYLLANARERPRRDWSDPGYAEILVEVEAHLRPTLEFMGYRW